MLFSNKRDHRTSHTKHRRSIEKRSPTSESHAEDFKSHAFARSRHPHPGPACACARSRTRHRTSIRRTDVSETLQRHHSAQTSTLQPPTPAEPVLPAVPTPPSVIRAQSAPRHTRAHRVGGVDVTLTTASTSQSNSSIPQYIQHPLPYLVRRVDYQGLP